MGEPVRLYEYGRGEWHDIARCLRADWTTEQFDESWERYCRCLSRSENGKAARRAQRRMG